MIAQHDHEVERAPASGIDILIVGGSVGGLWAALELHRQGHNVRLIEGKLDGAGMGDFVGLAPSATRGFKKYPGMSAHYSKIIYNPALTMHRYDGMYLGGPFAGPRGFEHLPTPVSRPKLLAFLGEYVARAGITVTYGKRVVEYYEDNDNLKAGVITDKDERLEADLVIAADGVASKSWKIVLGEDNKATSSGFSVYRVVYPTELALRVPKIAESFTPGEHDTLRVWLGDNTHAIVLVSKDLTTWFLTHKDSGKTASETWNRNLSAEDVLASLDPTASWDPLFLEVVKQTPPKTVVDYKLLWRNPNVKWTSSGGRILQVGDSAHSFLPTSANGGTQAMEDGTSIAACLKMAAKNNIELATRAHVRLRFERVACAQKAGFKNRETWHHTDWDAAKKHPERLVEQVGKWINLHDPEEYVYENWNKVVSHLVSGTQFKNTNTPPGYTYEPWTIDELLNSANEHRETIDAGDWS